MEYNWHPATETPDHFGRSYVLWVTDGKGQEWLYHEVCVWNKMQQRFIGSNNNSPRYRILKWALTPNANEKQR